MRVIAVTADEASKRSCSRCGGKLVRDARGPTSVVMERLDNGAMVRTMERLADAERLTSERAREADPLAGTKHERAPEDPKL